MWRNLLVNISIMYLIFTAGCSSKDGDQKVRKNVVNGSYLKSRSYQSFKEKAHHESEKSIRQEQEFSKFLNKALEEKPGKKLDSPLVINKSFIEKAFRDDQKKKPLLTMAFGLKQIYHPLAEINTPESDIHFFAMCKIASYDNCLIWLATAHQNKVVEAQMIATYNRALTYHETPVIRFNPPEIYVKINRSVQYPKTKLRSFALNYKVKPGGRIYRID